MRKPLYLLFVWAALPIAQTNYVDPLLAHQYFQEAQAVCEQEADRLWGVSLCGPMLLVDRKTRTIAANQPDLEGRLTQAGNVYVGRLPQSMNIANTAITWGGVKWTMLEWPLPTDASDRKRLMVHELFHRVQDQIGLRMSNPSNAHLDTREGRLWLQLEWRALREALRRRGDRRRAAGPMPWSSARTGAGASRSRLPKSGRWKATRDSPNTPPS